MNVMGLDIGHIVDLTTHVAQSGAIRSMEVYTDEIFDYVIGIIVLIYELDPADSE